MSHDLTPSSSTFRVVTDAPATQLDRLSPEDLEVVRECLTAAVRGPFIPDWDRWLGDDELDTSARGSFDRLG